MCVFETACNFCDLDFSCTCTAGDGIYYCVIFFFFFFTIHYSLSNLASYVLRCNLWMQHEIKSSQSYFPAVPYFCINASFYCFLFSILYLIHYLIMSIYLHSNGLHFQISNSLHVSFQVYIYMGTDW